MAILAAAADFHSWCNLIGVDVVNTLGYANIYKELSYRRSAPSSNAQIEGLYTIDLAGGGSTGYIPKPLIINADSVQELYIQLQLSVIKIYYASPEITQGDGRRIIKILNNSGALIASIGINNASYLASTSASTRCLAIYTYNSDGSVNSSSVSNVDLYANATNTDWYSEGNILHTKLQVTYKADIITPSNSFFRLYFGDCLICELLGASVITNANMALGSVKIRDNITASKNNGFVDLVMSSLLVADTPMFGAQVFPLKPSAYTANNQFTGAITGINTTIQDQNYVASALEVDTKLEFTATRPSGYQGASGSKLYAGKQKVKYIANYIYGRYQQDGGTSVNFTVVNNDGTSNLFTPDVFTIPANEDPAVYRTKFIASHPLDMDVSALSTFKTTITLTGV